MSKKKKYPQRWTNEQWVIELYEPLNAGWFIWPRKSTFIVRATTPKVAMRNFLEMHPEAEISLVRPLFTKD